MTIPWCSKFKYFGVMLVSGKSFNVDVEINRSKFLVRAYAILNRCGTLSEEVKMQLISSKCVPTLLYGMECLSYCPTENTFVCCIKLSSA